VLLHSSSSCVSFISSFWPALHLSSLLFDFISVSFLSGSEMERCSSGDERPVMGDAAWCHKMVGRLWEAALQGCSRHGQMRRQGGVEVELGDDGTGCCGYGIDAGWDGKR
jgi:hypothetical protein